MKSGFKTCKADLHEAFNEVTTYGVTALTKNANIKKRVANPDDYDRCGNDKRTG